MWPNYRISLVGYHCSIEFPCGAPLFYCCKYPTTYGVRVHPHNTSCFTLYTVWTFFCSHVLKKIKFFKPLPFTLKIAFWGGFRLSLSSLIFSSILRQITTYQNAYFLRKLRISNSWKQCVDVCKSTQCFKFLHSVDIFCYQVHTCHTKSHLTHIRKEQSLYILYFST